MKAAIYTSYGPADVVHIADVNRPVPRDDEVLIKVRAASVNPLDWRLLKGGPLLMRLFFGLTKPRRGRPGVDVAGELEAVGKNVTQFKPGDAVFGAARAALAEYACTKASRLAIKPDNVTFEQAASLAVAASSALQGLRNHGKIQPGNKVLVNGAAGGVGTFAVQIAKTFGAEVTGVCSTRNVDMVRSIGADEVIDYTKRDFTNSNTSNNQRYDLILDCVGNHSFSECKRVLKPDGRCVLIGAPHDVSIMGLLGGMIKTAVLSALGRQKAVMFIAKARQDDLALLGQLIATGKLKPVIDRRYSLSEASEALRYLEEGHARGKVIITLDGA
jgi:NADPH:quinone reductase-like Zn-dependent oxidoreductase